MAWLVTAWRAVVLWWTTHLCRECRTVRVKSGYHCLACRQAWAERWREREIREEMERLELKAEARRRFEAKAGSRD